MKAFIAAAVGGLALMAATGASATVVANFQLNGSLANGAAGGVTLTNNGATLGPAGLTFAANDGPTLENLGVISTYSLEIKGSLDSTGGYRKIADFSDRASDIGFYNLNGDIDFYPYAFGPFGVLQPETPFVVKLTRDSNKLVTGYINGVSQFSFTDSSNQAVINSRLHLFRDDAATGYGEASSGFIDYVTLDTNPSAGGVPEPSTWALTILGFAGMGATLRRRKAAVA